MADSVILSNKRFIITLSVDEDQDLATLKIQSTKNGPDLRHQDDVIAVINGQPLQVQATDARHAHAELPGAWSSYAGVDLMVRIGEFFDGWNLETGAEAS